MRMLITTLQASPDEAIETVDASPGLVSAYVLRPMDSAATVLVTVWRDAGDAAGAPLGNGARDYDAAFHAGVDHAAPAVRDLPGQVASFVGRGDDGSAVVVSLTTSLQALEDAQAAITATELLPDEDPALLPGPDRLQLCWVLATSNRAGAPA